MPRFETQQTGPAREPSAGVMLLNTRFPSDFKTLGWPGSPCVRRGNQLTRYGAPVCVREGGGCGQGHKAASNLPQGAAACLACHLCGSPGLGRGAQIGLAPEKSKGQMVPG